MRLTLLGPITPSAFAVSRHVRFAARLLRWPGPIALVTAVVLGPTVAGLAKPRLGVLVLTPMGIPGRICLGESAPIDLLVHDAANGMPAYGATLVLQSGRGASATPWTPGGMTRLMYQPPSEGSDTITITATAPDAAASALTLPATVERGRWTWDL